MPVGGVAGPAPPRRVAGEPVCNAVPARRDPRRVDGDRLQLRHQRAGIGQRLSRRRPSRTGRRTGVVDQHQIALLNRQHQRVSRINPALLCPQCKARTNDGNHASHRTTPATRKRAHRPADGTFRHASAHGSTAGAAAAAVKTVKSAKQAGTDCPDRLRCLEYRRWPCASGHPAAPGSGLPRRAPGGVRADRAPRASAPPVGASKCGGIDASRQRVTAAVGLACGRRAPLCRRRASSNRPRSSRAVSAALRLRRWDCASSSCRARTPPRGHRGGRAPPRRPRALRCRYAPEPATAPVGPVRD